MALYNPTSRTVVTEVKSMVVDAVRKVSTIKNSVSAKTDDEITSRDINVGSTALEFSINKHLIISSVHPIELAITQTQEVITYPPVTYTASISVPSTITEDQVLVITVNDPDIADLPDTQILVSNDQTLEEELIVLSRTPNTSTFTAMLPTTTGPSLDNDTIMQAVQGQTLTLTYHDQENESGVAQSITTQITVVPNPTYTGALKLDQTFVPGALLRATIYDKNSSVSIVATYVNQRTGEQELTTLTETIAGSGLFQYDLPTLDDGSVGQDNDGILNCVIGDQIVLQYTDLADESGAAQPIQTTIVVGTQTYLTGQLTLVQTRVGNPITVQVTDTDRHTSVTVALVNQSTNEQEDLVLQEVTPMSGVFVGQLPTVEGTGVWYKGPDYDGIMPVKANDIIRIMYTDPQGISGVPLLVQQDLVISPALPPPPGPDPIITQEDVTINVVTKLFVLDGTAENTKISIRKPDSNTNQYVRASLLLV